MSSVADRTGPDTRTEQLRAVAFTALSRAIPAWRNLPVTERQDIADKVLGALREEIEADGYLRGFADGERHAKREEVAP